MTLSGKKDMLCFSRTVVIALFAASSLGWAVAAQAADKQQHPFKPVTKDGHPYSIRVTTGCHETSGWEQGLTRRDPSLRHWTWVPIYSYDQGYIAANAKHSLPARPKNVYKKPTHVPLPVVNRQTASQPPAIASAPKYVKPIHVPLPVVEHPQATYQHVSEYKPRTPAVAPGSGDSTNLAGVLRKPAERPESPLSAVPLAAVPKTYGAYSDVYGRLHPPSHDHEGDSLAAAHVHGKMIVPKSY
jgi:hypothetical protein